MRSTDPKDSNKRYFRSGDRIVNLNGAWFFAAREGDLGPFPTREIAQREVQRFMLERQELDHFQQSRRAVRKKVMTASTHERVRGHLDQQVELGNTALTLDDDLLI